MREELRWVGAALGAVRDADVLLDELRSQGPSLPKLDAPAAEALLAQLSSERKAANERLLTILDSDRYLTLLSDLTAAANDPPLGGPAAEAFEASETTLPTKASTRCESVPRICATQPRRQSRCSERRRASWPRRPRNSRRSWVGYTTLWSPRLGFDAVAPAARRRRHWSPGS